ncbi:MAG: hypothetical protein HOW73_12815 [Polyangiaceae bacterium]|nr:hypothetical protein [Polyangiaceae bacterium]
MSRFSRIAASLACGVALAWVAPVASAQEGLSPGTGPLPPETRSDITAFRPYWGAAPPRWFAGVVFETAGISSKIELDLGYGRPHYLWAGLEVDSHLSLRGMNTFGGIRAVAPWGSIKFGPRFWTALNQKLIEPAESITRPMLDVDEGLKTRYLSLDAEIAFQIPLPYGSIGALVTGYGLFSVDDNFFVFEEALRVVIDPPFVGRFRLSYLAPIGDPPTLRIGGLAELIYNPGRDYINVRIGPATAVSLTHHLEAVAAVALSVYNPDQIGVAGADLGQIGLRYRWATGDLWPEFP